MGYTPNELKSTTMTKQKTTIEISQELHLVVKTFAEENGLLVKYVVETALKSFLARNQDFKLK